MPPEDAKQFRRGDDSRLGPLSVSGVGRFEDQVPGRNALSIAPPEQDNVTALAPFPGEWQVWAFAHNEVIGHDSFATFLQAATRRARNDVEQRDARLAAHAYANPRHRTG